MTLAQVNPAATTLTTLYSATGQALGDKVVICNTGTATAKVRVAVRPLGAAVATQMYLLYNEPIAGESSYFLQMGWPLSNTDVISVYSDTANVAFNLSGTNTP